jgi:protein TonB
MMNNAQLATASLDDIVFDGRNKAYGAYVLRGEYDRHVVRALIIATAMFALLMTFPLVARFWQNEFPAPVIKNPGVIDLTAIQFPDKVIPPPTITPPVTPPAAQVRPTTVRYVEFKVAKEAEATADDIPNQADLIDTQVGTVTFSGPGNPTLPELIPTDAPTATGEVVKPAAPYISVEQMPELPSGGGQAAIVAAIQRAANYPSQALRNGVEGKVYVSFVVNALGDITDIKILKGLGAGLDEETIRAIKSLPRFTPGRQNGQAVSVQFNVPVTYRIQ